MFINGNEINFAHVAPSAHDVDPKTLKLPSVKSMFKKSDRIMKTTEGFINNSGVLIRALRDGIFYTLLPVINILYT